MKNNIRVFNEDTGGKSGDMYILLLTKEQARTFIEMTKEAVAARPKKTTWKRIAKKLLDELCCW